MSRSIVIKNNTWIDRVIAHLKVPLYRNGYTLIFNAIATSGLGIVYWFLAARYYPTEIVGLNAALISTMTLLAGIARLNLDSALYRFIPHAGRATNQFIAAAYVVSMGLTLVVGGIFIVSLDIWSPAMAFLKASPWLGVWFVLMTAAFTIFALQDSVLMGLRQTMWVPLENLLFAVTKIVLLIMLVGLLPEFGIFASFTIPATIMLLPINVLIFGRLAPRHAQSSQEHATPILPRQVARYVAGVYFSYLFWITSIGLVPILVLQQAGSSANAYFYVPWLIGTSLQLISQNMNISLTIEGTYDQSRLRTYMRHALVQIARLLIPIVGLLLLGAPYILRIFGPDYATEGAWLLRWLALAALPHMVTNVYIAVARVRNQVGRIVLLQAGLSGLTLSLSYVFLHWYGITGVGLAWLMSYTVLAMIVLFARFYQDNGR